MRCESRQRAMPSARLMGKMCAVAQGAGRRTAAMTATAALLALPHQAAAAPQDGTVTSGVAAISQTGTTTNVTQSTDKAIINWRSFSVGSNETVNFKQPSSSSMTLNRVIGNEQSIINGTLNANGRVWLINSAGVLIGSGGSVNASGFTASALNIADADFLAGKYEFSGAGGDVVNLGSIAASPAGGGGHVVLMGRSVSNQGVITATRGTVALASGNKVTLNFNGNSLVNVTIDQGTLNALVENRQAILADGGLVLLTAKAADSLLSAQVNNTGLIQARSIGDLKGDIRLYAHGGTTMVDGTLDASAPVSGDGGFIETSGDRVKVADSAVITTKSATGTSGLWLIDPTNFTVAASGGDMTGAALGAALERGSVEIQSSHGGSGNEGNVNVNDTVSWGADSVLTLTAVNNININKSVTASGTNAGLALNYGGDYAINGAQVTLSGSGATLTMNDNVYTVVHSLSQLTSLIAANPTGRFALVEDIPTSGTTTTYTGAVVSSLSGTLAGLGHTITGLKITSTSNTVGLIGTLGSGGSIRDLGLVNATISGKQNVGALIGFNYGNLTNTYVTGSTVSSSSYNVGGLIGRSDAGTLTNVYVENSTVSTTNANAGGLIGNVTATTLNNSHFSGTVTASRNNIGGLAGTMDANSRIRNSYSTGTITANYTGSAISNVGGLAGTNGGTISDSWSSANLNVTNAYNVGGAAGLNSGTLRNVTASGKLTGYYTIVQSGTGATTGAALGGLVGNNSGSIAQSSANGNVTVSASAQSNNITMVGGFVGINYSAAGSASITDSSASGTVYTSTQSSAYGGFAGVNGLNAAISNSTASGNVTGGNSVGGFVGVNSGTITSSSASGNVWGLYTGIGGGFVGDNTNTGVIRSGRASGNVRAYGYADVFYGSNSGFVDGIATGTAVNLGKYSSNLSWGGTGSRNTGTASLRIQPAATGSAAAATGSSQTAASLQANPADTSGQTAQDNGGSDNRKRVTDSNVRMTGRPGASSGSVGTIRVDGTAVDAADAPAR